MVRRSRSRFDSGPPVTATVTPVVAKVSAYAALLALACSAAAATLIRARDHPLAGLISALVASAALVALAVLDRAGVGPSRAHVFGASAVLLTMAVVVPPRGSNDVWMYATYGRMLEHHHVSPYTTTPAQMIVADRRAHRPPDPILARSARQWRKVGAVYGPVFVAGAAAWMRVAGTSPLLARIGFQSLAALSVAWCLIALRRRGPPAALAVLGCHPLVIAFVVNGGHADALIGALVLASLLAAERRRLLTAGAVLGLAASVKATAGLALLGLVIWVWRRHGWRRSAGCAAIGAAVAGLPLLAAGGRAALRPLLAARGYSSRASVWQFLTLLRGRPVNPGGLAFVCVVVVGALLAWDAAGRGVRSQGSGPDGAMALTLAAPLVGFALLAPYVLPWYLFWGLPLCMVAGRSLLARVLVALMTLELFAYAYVARAPGLVNAAFRLCERGMGAVELGAVVLLIADGIGIGVFRKRVVRPLG